MTSSNADGTLYHNPRCSKSRATLELLKEKNINPEIILYLDTPPDASTLKNLISQLGITPRELLRNKEAEYKELNLKDPAIDDDSIIKAMTDHPKLIERPIYQKGGKAAIGRPPENVLEIL